jgi:zinc transport system substrate-binding protein
MRSLLQTLAILISITGMASAERLKVVASFLPLYAHAKSIAGERAEVSQLLPAGVGPHDFQFKPSDVKKIAEADLLIVNGLGLEDWLGGIVQQAGNARLVIVDTSKGVNKMASPQVVDMPHEHTAGHTHEHKEEGGANPHIWLDPVIAQIQARTILAALVKADPKNTEFYEKNASNYLRRLEKLNEDFRVQLAGLNPKNLITFHDAFPYLAKRYDLNYLGFIEEFPEKSPSPKTLAALFDVIKKNKVKVIFAEEGYEPKLLRTIAQQSGAIVAALDTLEVGAPTAEAYLMRMEANLAALKKAFGGG